MLSASMSPPLCCGMPELATAAGGALGAVWCVALVVEWLAGDPAAPSPPPPPPQPATAAAIAPAASNASSATRTFLIGVLMAIPVLCLVLSLPARCAWLFDVGRWEKLVDEEDPAAGDSFQPLSPNARGTCGGRRSCCRGGES